jgi:predicted alpha/beta-fold hydrolase
LPQREQLPNVVMLEIPRHGGHVGFVHGALPGRLDWLPQRLLAHFDTHLPHQFSVR